MCPPIVKILLDIVGQWGVRISPNFLSFSIFTQFSAGFVSILPGADLSKTIFIFTILILSSRQTRFQCKLAY